MPFCQDVAFHRLLQPGFSGTAFKAQLLIQGINFKKATAP